MKSFIVELLLSNEYAVQEIGNGQYTRICRCGTQGEAMKIADALTVLEAINYLRSTEASHVTILCEPPDFTGTQAAIEVSGDWNHWGTVPETARFEGQNIGRALLDAVEAKQLTEKG